MRALVRSVVILAVLASAQFAHAIPRASCPAGTVWDAANSSCIMTPPITAYRCAPGTAAAGVGCNCPKVTHRPTRDQNAPGTAICKATGATAPPAAADRDHDGIADDDDACPDVAEDKDGFQDADGCPEAESTVSDLRPMGFNCKPGVAEGAGCKCPTGYVALRDKSFAICQDRRPKGAARSPSVPTGYRCGPGGKLVLNQGCTCVAGRIERRDPDGVSVCAKAATTTSTSETKPLPVKVPDVKPAPDQPVAGNCPSWKGDVAGAMGAKDYACVRTLLLPRLNDGSLSAAAARYLRAACGALSDRACEQRAAEKLGPPAAEPKPATPVASGRLNINAIPAAKVILDGTLIGATPIVGYEVLAGTHSVVFVHPEQGRKTTIVTVRAGETSNVNVNFGGP